MKTYVLSAVLKIVMLGWGTGPDYVVLRRVLGSTSSQAALEG